MIFLESLVLFTVLAFLPRLFRITAAALKTRESQINFVLAHVFKLMRCTFDF